MADITLNANTRKTIRKSDNKNLRRNGRVPGVYYAKNQEPVAIEVGETSLFPLVYTSETHMVNLQIGDQSGLTCVLKDIQFDPVTDKIVHFDLQGVSTSEKMSIEVPVVVTGQAAGIKQGGILQVLIHKLEVECYPKDMPEHIEIDVTSLNLNESIHVSDLKYENIDILNAEDAVVVSIVPPKAEKETPAEGEEVKEPQVISKGKVDKAE